MRMQRAQLHRAQLAANARRWYVGVQLRSWWTIWRNEALARKQLRRNFALAVANARLMCMTHHFWGWRANALHQMYIREHHSDVLLSAAGDTEEVEMGTLNSASQKLVVYVAVTNAAKVRQRQGMDMLLALIAGKRENERRAKQLFISMWTGSGRVNAMLQEWSKAAIAGRVEREMRDTADAHWVRKKTTLYIF